MVLRHHMAASLQGASISHHSEAAIPSFCDVLSNKRKARPGGAAALSNFVIFDLMPVMAARDWRRAGWLCTMQESDRIAASAYQDLVCLVRPKA